MDEDALEIRPPGQQFERPFELNAQTAAFKCTPCQQIFTNEFDLQVHLQTKAHTKKLADAAEMDDRDMYVDDTTVAYVTVMRNKTKFSGCEYVVLDKTDGETKCLLCKAFLRDTAAITDHLKTAKHLFAYIEKHYPEIFRSIQRRSKNQQEINQKVRAQADILINRYGKKEPLVHEKGYYFLLPEEQKQVVDRHLEAKRRELDDQRKCRLDPDGNAKPPEPTPPAPTTTADTDARSSSKRRTRSRSPASSNRRDKERDRPRERDTHTTRDRDQRQSPRRRTAAVDVDKGVNYDALDRLDELPTEFDIYNLLCSSDWVTFGPNEAAKIQPQLDEQLDSPIIGSEYVAEYTDPRNVYQPGYVCTLCESRMNPIQAIRHFAMDKHQLNYMKKHCERQYTAVQISTLSVETRNHMKRRYVADIAAKENRRKIVSYIRLNKDQRQVFRHHRRMDSVQASAVAAKQPETSPAAKSKDKDQRRRSRSPRDRDNRRDKSRDRDREREGKAQRDRDSRPPPPRRSRSRSRSRDLKPASRARTRSPDVVPVAAAAPPPPRSQPIIQGLDARKLEREKAALMVELNRDMPPFCEIEYESDKGCLPLWYSIRRMSIDYYRRLAEPDALFFSVRDPEWLKSDFYGDWNPQVMRRLQDKFNFKLEHIRWLQKLLMDWRVPLYVPLQPIDLKPLEEEVESAVLDELLDQVLKPVNLLRNVQVIDHTPPGLNLSEESAAGNKHSASKRRHTRSPSPTANKDEKKGISISLNVADTKKTRVEPAAPSSSKADKKDSPHHDGDSSSRRRGSTSRDRGDSKLKSNRDKPESSSHSKEKPKPVIEPKNEKEVVMLKVIDQLLSSMNNMANIKNDVLSLILGFANSRELLFRLATQRPTELQRLVELAKRPVLKAPEAMIEQLRKMLQRETQAAESEQKEAKRKQAADEDKHRKDDEDEKRLKEQQLKQRIDQVELMRLHVDGQVHARTVQARQDMLKNKQKESSQADQRAASPGVQVFTPKVPAAAAHTLSTAAVSGPLSASTFAHPNSSNQPMMAQMMGGYPAAMDPNAPFAQQQYQMHMMYPNASQYSQFNPNVSQFNPNVSQFNPNVSQFNPNVSQYMPPYR